MPRPVAYLDESFHEGGPLGFYVLAAAVLATELDQARDAMRALRGGRRTNKLHWNEMDERDRHDAVTVASSLTGTYLVASELRCRRVVRSALGASCSVGSSVNFTPSASSISRRSREAASWIDGMSSCCEASGSTYPRAHECAWTTDAVRRSRCSGWRISSPAPFG